MSEGLGQKFGGPRRQAQEKIRTAGMYLSYNDEYYFCLFIIDSSLP